MRADRVFLGVVAVGVPINSLKHVYETIGNLNDQSFILAKADGTVLVRYPDTSERAGQKLPPNAGWSAALTEGTSRFRSDGVFDAKSRIISSHVVPGYPLFINVGTTEDAALAVWRRFAAIVLIGTLLAVACSGGLLWLLISQFRGLRASRTLLAAKTRERSIAHTHLDAAINNMVQGITMFDSDYRLIFLCGMRGTSRFTAYPPTSSNRVARFTRSSTTGKAWEISIPARRSSRISRQASNCRGISQAYR